MASLRNLGRRMRKSKVCSCFSRRESVYEIAAHNHNNDHERRTQSDATSLEKQVGDRHVVEEEVEDEYAAMLLDASRDVSDDEFQRKPTEEQLDEIAKMHVLDRSRNKVLFGDLTRSKDTSRHLVIFIRHFFCGNCYGFVRALSAELPPSELEKLSPPTTISIVGCGDPILISQYIAQTGCPYNIYADPSRSIYKKLGFAATTAPPPKMPAYVNKYSLAFWPNILRSLKLTARTGKVSGGPVVQVGGELIWIDGELQHLHRMRDAGDHMEIPELIRLLKRQGQRIAALNGKPGSMLSVGARSIKEWARQRVSSIFNGGGQGVDADGLRSPALEGLMKSSTLGEMVEEPSMEKSVMR